MGDLICDIREMLRDGFGVEDIALQLDVPVDGVRRMIQRWRETGVLKAILKKRVADTGRQPCIGLTETALKHGESDVCKKYTF